MTYSAPRRRRPHTFGPLSNVSIVTDTPDLRAIRHEIHTAIGDASEFYDRAQHALEVRYCQWDGQTSDGRKWGSPENPAFPWAGASDARIRTVDMVINEQVDMLTTALSRMNIQAIPVEARDADWAGRMSALLRWYLANEMADEADSEIELLANYMLTYGSSVLGIGWHQELTYEETTLTLEDLAAMAQESGDPQYLADVGRMIFDELAEPTAVEWITKTNRMLTERDARRILKDLRELGSSTFPKPRLRESRPCLRALQTFQDVFFPVGTSRLQRSRWIAERELLTESELREKAEGDDAWDRGFVEEVLEKYGGSTFNESPTARSLSHRQQNLGGIWGEPWTHDEEVFEVWHFFTRATHRGVPAIWQTTLHPACDKYWARHAMLPYAHGEYPHVEFVRERTMRNILASRGWPEVLDSEQAAIKVEYDARRDRSSVTTLPPIKEKLKAGTPSRAFGPGVRIPVSKMDDLEVMNWGAPDPTSVEVERNTRRNVAEYVGRPNPDIDPQLVIDRKQAMTDRWLKRWRRAGSHMLALAQQYTPDQTIIRIVGVIPKSYDVSQAAIAGGFDLILTFNTQFLNQEYAFGLLERMEQYVLPIDTDAIIDRGELLRYVLAMVDPTLADRAVRDTASANQGEIDDEQKNFALMFSGQEVPMKLKGQNHALRLQVLQNALQKNPVLQQAMSVRPDFKQLLEQRAEFLTQQVTQQQNATIGRFGTTPTAGSDGMGGGL